MIIRIQILVINLLVAVPDIFPEGNKHPVRQIFIVVKRLCEFPFLGEGLPKGIDDVPALFVLEHTPRPDSYFINFSHAHTSKNVVQLS